MKKILFLYLFNEKTEVILSSKIQCPKSGIFTTDYWVRWWGESGKVILQVSIAIFRALSKNFSGKDGSAPWKNWPIRLCTGSISADRSDRPQLPEYLPEVPQVLNAKVASQRCQMTQQCCCCVLFLGALFYSSVKCTGARKYPYKDILVHRCTSPMNKTMQGLLSVTGY